VLPTEELFHVDGTPRHRWAPPVAIPAASGANADDAAMAFARARLLEQAHAR